MNKISIKEQTSLKVKLKGKDAELFKSAITKLSDSEKPIGYNATSLNADEQKLFERLDRRIN